jgi:hypothetical protein
VILGAEFFGAAAHDIGDVDASAEPRLVIVAAFAFEHAADLVQLADIDGAVPSMFTNAADQR